MKTNKGSLLVVVGLMFTTLGLTLLSDYKLLQYSALILGVIFTILSVFVYDRSKKSQRKLKE